MTFFEVCKKKSHIVVLFHTMWQKKNGSGKRGSNPPPTAWKAVALPNELLPQKRVGEEGFEPPKA